MKDHHYTGIAALTPGTSPSQSFRKAGLARFGGLFSGQSYQGQYKTNLAQPVWNNLAAPILANDITSMAFDFIGTDPQTFLSGGATALTHLTAPWHVGNTWA